MSPEYWPQPPKARRAPMPYLPDFYLPSQDCWVEMKGFEPTTSEESKMERLTYVTGREGYIFWGSIPLTVDGPPQVPPSGDVGRYPSAWAFRPVEAGDRGWNVELECNNKWCECPHCGLLGITYNGAAEGLPCACFTYAPGWEIGLSVDAPRMLNAATPRLVEAYDAARQARFEHREVPVTITAPAA